MSDVNILYLSTGARQARGVTVVIDVFRAFTTACQLIENGAERILPVADLEEARLIMRRQPQFVLIGERNGIKLEDAAYGNSPSEVANGDFCGQTIVLTTTAGTQGFSNAIEAEQLLSASLANADALVRYLRRIKPPLISLVCMGFRNQEPSDEDTLCAEYIKRSLSSEAFSQAEITAILEASPFSAKFFDPKQAWAPKEDFYRCIQLGRFDFILRLEPQPEGFQALIPYPS